MKTLTNKRQHPGDRQALANQRRRTAAAGPAYWLIVNSCIDAGDASVGDAKTRAACCGSSGKPFSVSLGVAAPPACCSLHFDWLGGGGQQRHSSKSEAEPEDNDGVCVIAGHDDALLIQMRVPDPNPTSTTLDYFLYEAGAAGRRPPSLSLLPGCNIPIQFAYRNAYDPTPRFRHLSMNNTGILRRRGDLLASAVPVGNRFLCWVDYNSGFILCDMGKAAAEEEETPKLLRYVPLPPVTPRHDCYLGWPHCCTTLGAAGADTVRFVSVIRPPGCCGGSISSSSNVITTWTMTLSTEEATAWVMDDVVLNCDEMIRNPNHGCLPRDKHLEYPMVSSDDPDVIYFKVGAMATAINTRTKKLLSVVPSGIHEDEDLDEPPHLITAKLRW
ncbi:unnamed protein product [Urochloa decumbens]|uniref:DUF1618 domain-containing protein n=1 Tax=Urochloa decumbens TaxID=240449 RepID=A0ABC9BUS6_9POAL